MSDTIIAALISAAVTLIAAAIALVGVLLPLYRKNSNNKGVSFLKSNDELNDLLGSVNEICMYTVNSYELCNSVNTLLERNPDMYLHKLKILVRWKENESENDFENLVSIIEMWKRWVKDNRISELTIIGYNHDPDHYYTILGDKLVFTGHVYFDNTKPTGTNVSYSPLVFRNNTSLGKKVIEEYIHHFNHLAEINKDKILYTSKQN